MPHRSNTVSSVFCCCFFFFINPLPRVSLPLSLSLSDALMLGLLTEHNGSNPLLIRLSSSRSPSPLFPVPPFWSLHSSPLICLSFLASPLLFTLSPRVGKKRILPSQKKNVPVFLAFQIHLFSFPRFFFYYMPFLNMLFLIIAKQMILQGFSYFPVKTSFLSRMNRNN